MKNIYLLIIFLFSVLLGQAQMVTSNSAVAQSCDCYTITPDALNLSGGVFSPNTIDLNNPFNFTFQVSLGTNDTWGADGIVFVLQQGQSSTNNVAQAIGWGGMTTSLGIEIDTWENSGAPYNDPASDHITIMSNGDFSSTLSPSVNIPNIEDGAFHTFNVMWDPGLQVLTVFLDGNFITAYNGDIINSIFGGNPNVYFGFTGATGGVSNLQQVCMYRTSSFTPDVTNVCIGQNVNFTDNSTSDLGEITSYYWDFGDGTFSNLQNPSHSWSTSGTKNVTLTITDLSGCTDVSNVNITVLPGISTTFNIQDVNCFGGSDGAISTTPTNGTGPYTYNWDIPSNQQSPTGLSAGTYNLTITDNLGCTGTNSATVAEPASALSISNVAVVDANCGSNNGSITITAAGGTTGYQYSIDGGGLQPNNVFNNLSAGTYLILVQDANGCSVSQNVTVNQATMLSITSVSTTDATCGGNNGEIIINVSNGTTPYTYALNTGATNTNVLTTHTFTGLAQGIYDVTVTDANNCSVFQNNVSVNNATTLAIDIPNSSTSDVTCNGGNDGSLNIAITGGTPNFQYSIDGTNFQASPSFSGLNANTYVVEVVDGNNCTATGNLTINEPTALSIDNITINTQVSCNGGNDGQVTISASGGNGSYLYSLDGGINTQVSNVFSNLGAGSYTLSLIDATNIACLTTANGDFNITEPTPLTIQTITPTDVSCNGANDGQIEVTTVSGGTPAYEYSLDGVTYQTQTTFTSLGFGTYTVYVRDANNCGPVTQQVTINESAPLMASLGNSDTTVCLGSQSNLCAVVTGGTQPYSYIWNGTSVPMQCVPVPSNTTGTTTITLSVTDASGCVTTNTVSKDIHVLPPISLNATSNPVNGIVCPGDQVTLLAEATGGNNGPYYYTWTNDVDGNILTGATQQIEPNQLTNYTVTVSDGCTAPDESVTIPVNVFTIPEPTFSATPNSGCTPLESTFSHDIPQAEIDSQMWTFENGNTSDQALTTQVFVDEGCTNVQYTMTTNDGCVLDTTLLDFVCVHPFPVANFEYSPEEPDIMDTEVMFTNLTTNGDAYLWTFGTGDSTNSVSPAYTFPIYGARDYEVWLFASNSFGCVDSTKQIVHIKELPYFYIPNAFTPETNNMNESFGPVLIPGFVPYNYRFSIYDRWGELIYETNDIYSFWNGKYNGKVVPLGTYVWQISFTLKETDERVVQEGHVSVIR
ncbi:MAG: lectin-like domain-containing protein [Putridiphycobacter sp.]